MAQGSTTHGRRDLRGARGTDQGHWRANAIHKAARWPLPRGGSHPEGAPTNGYAPDNSELPEPTLSEALGI